MLLFEQRLILRVVSFSLIHPTTVSHFHLTAAFSLSLYSWFLSFNSQCSEKLLY